MSTLKEIEFYFKSRMYDKVNLTHMVISYEIY